MVAVSFYHNDVLVGRQRLIDISCNQPKVTSVSVSPLTDGKNCTGLVIADKKLKMYIAPNEKPELMREVEQLQIYRTYAFDKPDVTEYTSADSDYGMTIKKFLQAVVVLAACGIAASTGYPRVAYSFLNQSTIE
ncbi:hypothetical protein SPFM14_00088 [Salmonella phage SPFM14]|nr:hypothetical protein SPFM14_00088 [Salmonella phage SPFM14]